MQSAVHFLSWEINESVSQVLPRHWQTMTLMDSLCACNIVMLEQT